MKLNELLNIKYPIIQGGMANIATGAFAASVSNAGGLGLIGAGGMNAKMLKAEIQACKKLTNQPFGVNIMLLNPDAKEMAQIVIDEHVPVVHRRPNIQQLPEGMLPGIPVQKRQVGTQAHVQRHPLRRQPLQQRRVLRRPDAVVDPVYL